uniref:Putative UDP-glucose/GDP-mannose dehydrogenasese n=1 Tax=viral metagenome TaxID=1070528 RepID=A0A6H1ZY13_9ZZZZ
MKRSIGVVGLGKLGLPLAVLFSKHFRVYGVDINSERLQQILDREQFFEPELNEYLKKYGDNFTLSLSYETLKDCKIVFIITQTPSLPNGKFDLQYVESALKQLHKANPKCLAVIGSTINVGDMDKLRLLHKRIVYNPEFIKQGSIISDFENPKFVLIGAYDTKDGLLVEHIWNTLHDKPCHITQPKEAEIAKLSLNVSFTLGITFANVIGEVCKKFNADAKTVLDLIYKDRRNYNPGLGFGGACFPRDVECFGSICDAKDIDSGCSFAAFLLFLNDSWIDYYIEKISKHNKDKIGILGIGYKLNVPYTEQSQSLEIAKRLEDNGFQLHVFDPLAEKEAKKHLPNAIFYSTLKECLANVDLVFVGLPYTFERKLLTGKIVVNPWR